MMEARRDAFEDAREDDEHAAPGERFGFGVCSRGTCVEPCGPNGGCVR
jgi:hypothetical protein